MKTKTKNGRGSDASKPANTTPVANATSTATSIDPKTYWIPTDHLAMSLRAEFGPNPRAVVVIPNGRKEASDEVLLPAMKRELLENGYAVVTAGLLASHEGTGPLRDRLISSIPFLRKRLETATSFVRQEFKGLPVMIVSYGEGLAPALDLAARDGAGVSAVCGINGRPDMVRYRLQNISMPVALAYDKNDDVLADINEDAADRLIYSSHRTLPFSSRDDGYVSKLIVQLLGWLDEALPLVAR